METAIWVMIGLFLVSVAIPMRALRRANIRQQQERLADMRRARQIRKDIVMKEGAIQWS